MRETEEEVVSEAVGEGHRRRRSVRGSWSASADNGRTPRSLVLIPSLIRTRGVVSPYARDGSGASEAKMSSLFISRDHRFLHHSRSSVQQTPIFLMHGLLPLYVECWLMGDTRSNGSLYHRSKVVIIGGMALYISDIGSVFTTGHMPAYLRSPPYIPKVLASYPRALFPCLKGSCSIYQG